MTSLLSAGISFAKVRKSAAYGATLFRQSQGPHHHCFKSYKDLNGPAVC